MLEIESMSSVRLDTLRRLHAEAFGGDWPSAEYSRNLYAADSGGCFLALLDGEPVGYVCTHVNGSVGFLGPLGVLPHYRGRGYGGTLVQAGVDYLKARCDTVGPETTFGGPAIGLYSRLGFRETARAREMGKALPRNGVPQALGPTLRLGTDIVAKDAARVIAAVASWSADVYQGIDFSGDLALFLSAYWEHVVFHFDGDAVDGFYAHCAEFRGEPWFAVRPLPQNETVLRELVVGRIENSIYSLVDSFRPVASPARATPNRPRIGNPRICTLAKSAKPCGGLICKPRP